jgi:hypothetical protein
MGSNRTHTNGIGQREEIWTMPDLVILALLRPASRRFECGDQILLADLFNVRPAKYGSQNESLTVISLHTLRIGYQPRLHHWNHKVAMIIGRSCRPTPLVAPLEMSPWGIRFGNGVFSVYEEDVEGVWVEPQGDLEIVKREWDDT